MSNTIEELRAIVSSTGKTQNERIARLFGNRCYDGSDVFGGGPELGLGGEQKREPPYPAASLPFNDTTTQDVRAKALKDARVENPFNYKVLPGATFHGNIDGEQVQLSKLWRTRGDLDEPEDNFGVNDADEDFNGIRLLEGTIAYLEKNFDSIVSSVDIAARFINLLGVIYTSLADNKLERFTFEVMDPMLIVFPHRKCRTVDELDFYPTFCPSHPKYEERIIQWPKAPFDKDFRDDELLSYFMTSCPTPIFDYFKPYTQHQDNFPVTNEQFTRVEGFKSDSLEKALADNRLFILDYKRYHDETVAARNWDNFGARLFASICLFAVPVGGGKLKPIAIQTTQTPKQSGFWGSITWSLTRMFGYGNQAAPQSKIITPADDYWAWQMAKNTVTTMTAQIAILDHLSMHLYVAPLAISYFRNFPTQHPLRSLLEPHMMGLTTNNFRGVFEIVGFDVAANSYGDPEKGLLTGAIERLSGFSSKSFLSAVIKRKNQLDFYSHSTPYDRKSNPSYANLDDYPQHDDNKLFPIIKEWVDAYIRLYYVNDSDVLRDNELQLFLSESANEGKISGIPDNAKTVEELTDVIARIITWLSVNHAFTSLISYLKLCSLGYYSSYPIEPSQKYTETDWLNICPPMNVGAGLFFFSRIFTDLPQDWHRTLGKYPKGQFKHDPRIYAPLEVFQNKMKALDDELRVKNSNRRWAYDLRMPSTITLSPWN